MFFFLGRLLHLAIIHEAKDYIKQMIDLSKNTPFLNAQNDLRQVCDLPLSSVDVLFALILINSVT